VLWVDDDDDDDDDDDNDDAPVAALSLATVTQSVRSAIVFTYAIKLPLGEWMVPVRCRTNDSSGTGLRRRRPRPATMVTDTWVG
jgi:hypothetical protein